MLDDAIASVTKIVARILKPPSGDYGASLASSTTKRFVRHSWHRENPMRVPLNRDCGALLWLTSCDGRGDGARLPRESREACNGELARSMAGRRTSRRATASRCPGRLAGFASLSLAAYALDRSPRGQSST